MGGARTPAGGRFWRVAVALLPFACSNCGFWQRAFAVPTMCPVCLDFRHTPPEDGPLTFLTPAEVAARYACVWSEDGNGVVTFRNEPRLGTIGANGYLVPHPAGGNVVFEVAGWVSDEALAFLEDRGGVRWLAASHPHAYGALWRLQERFPEAAVVVQTADLPWTGAFRVTRPFDGRLELAPGRLELRHVGGHFPGQAVLWWASGDDGVLFAGDMVKFHPDAAEPERAGGISTHKAFNRRVPMSHAETRRYREVVASLPDFGRVYTSFERARAGRETLLALFDEQLRGEPFFGPMAVA